MVETNTVWRDFATDGDPTSGAHKPIKSEIREWGNNLTAGIAGAQDILAAAQAAAAEAARSAATVSVAAAAASTAASLLADYTHGFAIDATAADFDEAVLVRDTATPANDYNGDLAGSGISTNGQQKLCVQADGSLRFSTANRSTFSNVFSNAVWTKTGITLSAEADGATLLTTTAVLGYLRHANVVVSGNHVGIWATFAVLAKAGSSSWCYLNTRQGGDKFVYFNLAAGTIGTIAAGTKAFIYNATTCPYPEIDIPAGYWLIGASNPLAAGGVLGDVGPCDADASTAVTVGRTLAVQKSQMYYGVHAQRYIDIPDTTQRHGPAIDWTHGEQALLLEPTGGLTSTYGDDFTQAAWVKTNLTAALDATGPHGEPCSTLTATAASASALQTIAAAAAYCSAYVRRKTGTGTVTFTTNGTTGEDITATLADGKWHRVHALGTNPDTFGFLIATSGDEIEVALAHRNTTAALLSPWPSYGLVASSRGGDQVSVPSTRFTHVFPGIVYADIRYTPHTPAASGHVPWRYGNTAKTSTVNVSMITTGTTRHLLFSNARLYLPAPSERLEITARLVADDYCVSVNGEPPLLMRGAAPTSLDNMWIGDTLIGAVWLRRLVSVVGETFTDDETIYWRYSGNTGDVGLKRVAVAAKQTSGVAAKEMHREPAVLPLWERETEAGIALFWKLAGTSEGAGVEYPQKLLQRNYVYNRVTNLLTPVTAATVLFTPSNYPTDGQIGTPVVVRVESGTYKGRLIAMNYYNVTAAGARNVVTMINDANGDPSAWSAPATTVSDGGAAVPASNGGFVQFPADHPTYPGRILTTLWGFNAIRAIWTDTGGGAAGTDWTVGTTLTTTLIATDETFPAVSANHATLYAMSRGTAVAKRLWSKSTNGGSTWTELAVLDAPELYSSGQVSAELRQMDPAGDFGRYGRLLHARCQGDTNYAFRTGPRLDYAVAADAPVFGDAWLPFYHGRYFGYVSARRLFGDHIVLAVEGSHDTTGFNNTNHMYLCVLQPPWPGFGGASQSRRYTAPDE